VVSNPEFLKEGAALEDFLKPDRVVVGADSEEAVSVMKELYAPFVRTENPIIIMDILSAEMTKYAANAMLATKISFINEIARVCESVGADIDNIRKGIGFDGRIGFKFLFPGVGYGGSCFPKDVKALIQTGARFGQKTRILEAVEEVNESQKRFLAEKVIAHFGQDLRGTKMAVWGLAFKPRTDDMRDAPSITIIEMLLKHGAKVRAYDPEAVRNARKFFGDRIEYAEAVYDVLEGADALLLITEWNEFRRPNFDRMIELMKQPVVFDGRNVYDPKRMTEMGFVYYGIGRK
jgi:UDPglucose 6-dehydrogenase